MTFAVADRERPEDELDEREPAVLPAREAMSLITPDATPTLMPELPTTPDGAEAAQTAAIDAQGSSSGEESVTSENRSEHFSNEDTAVSET